MEVKQSVEFRAPVKLVSSTTGAGVTGKAYTDVTVYIQKQAASSASKVLASVAEFIEVDSTNFAGVYDLVLTTGNLDTLGFFKYSVACTGCVTYHGLLEVVANVEADTYARIGAPVGASISADIAALPAAPSAADVAAEVWSPTRDAQLQSLTIARNSASPAVSISNAGAGDAVDIVAAAGIGIDVAGGALERGVRVSAGMTAVALDGAGEYGLYITGAAAPLNTAPVNQIAAAVSVPSAATVADAVLDEAMSDHTTVGSLGEAIQLILGLNQSNYILDQTTYNTEGLLTSGRIRVFPTKTDTDNETNALATYTVTGTAESAPNEMLGQSLKVTRNP